MCKSIHSSIYTSPNLQLTQATKWSLDLEYILYLLKRTNHIILYRTQLNTSYIIMHSDFVF